MRKVIEFINHLITVIRFNVMKFIDRIAIPAIKVVEVIKANVNDPTFDVIVGLTKTQVDDKILAAFRKAIPLIEERLKLFVEIDDCLKSDDTAETIKCLGRIIDRIDPELRPEIYKYIAKLISLYLTDEPVTDSKANWLIETAYQKYKHKEFKNADFEDSDEEDTNHA